MRIVVFVIVALAVSVCVSSCNKEPNGSSQDVTTRGVALDVNQSPTQDLRTQAKAVDANSSPAQETPLKNGAVDSELLISEALKIIQDNIVIGENVLSIQDGGDQGPLMDAYRKLSEASAAQPEDLSLRYAAICALRLAAQFDSACKELAAFSQERPQFPLAKFTLEAWQARGDEIAPAPFRYPECILTTSELHPFYARHVKTCVLYPARDGIYPRAVLFLKDNEAYWTKEMLKDAKVEIAVVHESHNPQLAAIYVRTLFPGKRPDLQEALAVLSLPKAYLNVAGWLYLCTQDFIDFVVIDNNEQIILNQRVQLTKGTQNTLAGIRDYLLETPGQELSDNEVLRICGEFQNRYTLDDIEAKFFPPK